MKCKFLHLLVLTSFQPPSFGSTFRCEFVFCLVIFVSHFELKFSAPYEVDLLVARGIKYAYNSDVEEEYAFEANLAADHDMDSEGEEISDIAATESYAARTFIVKRVLSSQMGQAEQLTP